MKYRFLTLLFGTMTATAAVAPTMIRADMTGAEQADSQQAGNPEVFRYVQAVAIDTPGEDDLPDDQDQPSVQATGAPDAVPFDDAQGDAGNDGAPEYYYTTSPSENPDIDITSLIASAPEETGNEFIYIEEGAENRTVTGTALSVGEEAGTETDGQLFAEDGLMVQEQGKAQEDMAPYADDGPYVYGTDDVQVSDAQASEIGWDNERDGDWDENGDLITPYTILLSGPSGPVADDGDASIGDIAYQFDDPYVNETRFDYVEVRNDPEPDLVDPGIQADEQQYPYYVDQGAVAEIDRSESDLLYISGVNDPLTAISGLAPTLPVLDGDTFETSIGSDDTVVAAEGVTAWPSIAGMGYQGDYSGTDLELLTKIICNEAGGAIYSDELQLACGQVVLNRVASGRYPDTIAGVVYQAGQYDIDWGTDFRARLGEACYQRAQANAMRLLSGERFIPDSCLYEALFPQGTGIYKTYAEGGTVTYICYG